MPSAGTGDPLLKGRDWAELRAYWRKRRLPCARCGGQIDYEAPKTSPDAFDLGHIIGRDEARALAWPRARINSVANTQPEHARCNRSAGAQYRNAKHEMPFLVIDEW